MIDPERTPQITRQRTVAAPARLHGVGLHTGGEVELEILPAAADAGVVFVRTDLPGDPRIRACAENLAGPPRRTALRQGSAEVQTVEHLMATLYAMGIHNAEVRLDGPEVPGMDGSALPFYEALRQAGVEEQDRPVRDIRLREPIALVEDGTSVVACSREEGLSLAYTLDYRLPHVPVQHLAVEITEEVFAREIAGARTFVLAEEARALQAAGLGKGATTRNTLVISPEGVVENQLRFEDELVRHKILDLVGDLALAGGRIHAHVVATRSGHALNRRLARSLAEAAARGAGGWGAFRAAQAAPHAPAAARAALPDRGSLMDILATLPHRYPFLLVDRVLELNRDRTWGRGVKNVSFNEEFFRGHFPQQPVMPGVLQLEAMAQMAGLVLLTHERYAGRLAYVLSIDKAKFRRPVVPGDQLLLEATIRSMKARTAQASTFAYVEGAVVAEAEIRFALASGSRGTTSD